MNVYNKVTKNFLGRNLKNGLFMRVVDHRAFAQYQDIPKYIFVLALDKPEIWVIYGG